MRPNFIAFEIIYIVIAISFFSVSIMNLFAPRWVWEKFESWRAIKEPSDTYFLGRRIMGAVFLVIAIFIFGMPTFRYLMELLG